MSLVVHSKKMNTGAAGFAIAALVISATCCWSPPTEAAMIWYDFNNYGPAPLDGPDGNIRSFSSGGVNVRVSAYGTTGPGGRLERAYLGQYRGGLGVTNQNEGSGSSRHHTLDNYASTDFILFEFSQSVTPDRFVLTGFGDTDVSVYYQTARGPLDLRGQSPAAGGWNGWSLDEHNAGSNVAIRTANINDGLNPYAANKLLVSASLKSSHRRSKDYVKIKKLKILADPKPVPDEGATLALLGISVVGLSGLSRKQRST